MQSVLPALVPHIADTSLVAELDDAVVGFVGGYRPRGGSLLTIWQMDVEPALRGQGLGTALLHTLIQCPGCKGVEFVEASVPSANLAAIRLFERFARDLQAPCESIAVSTPKTTTQQPREQLLRIGPIRIEHAMKVQGQHETL